MLGTSLTTANPDAPEEALLHSSCTGITLMQRGNHTDVYDLGSRLLLIATDRLVVRGTSLPQGLPGKGLSVNQLSAFWFRLLRNVAPNHFITTDPGMIPADLKDRFSQLSGRIMLAWKTTPVPVRCKIRGYLAGDGWRSYLEAGQICGNILPAGLAESQRLPYPIFCPELEVADETGDAQINFPTLQKIFGKQLSSQLRDAAFKLYFAAWEHARERGIIIAETTFTFGLQEGKLLLIGHCITPDASRFWLKDTHRTGVTLPSLDQQTLGDYLADHPGTTLEQIPERILEHIGANYHEVCRRIVGKSAR